MARPKKSNAEKLDSRLPHMRCTKRELLEFKKQADKFGLSLSEYGRRLIFNREVKVREISTTYDPNLLFQIQAIGNNLNQLVRITHATGEPLEGIEDAIKRIITLSDHMIDQMELT